MSTFTIHTLGCGSAKPTVRHLPSCTVVDHRGTLYMIDCGEGAQRSFQLARLKFSRLRHIFLTHLHGDHVLGLPGLLSSLALGNEGGKITIHTFAEGERILRTILDFFAKELTFELDFNIIRPEDAVILHTPSLSVRSVRLHHRVPCVGYIFEEKPRQRHIRRDMIDFHKVPVSKIKEIKEGADFVTPEGKVIPNTVLTSDADPSLSYAHIADTIYMPQLAAKIGPVDLLFHETTYLEQHHAEAKARFHSTARQAAAVARDAGAKKLLTGHYSSRYKDDSQFAKEAQSIFPNVILNHEGLSIPLD
ncbi:MAG: ribonuclease Z [Muribaculaceae bacterium]|nr:ribonuclease Z [Muribaculaceae bacterium]